MTVQLRSGGQGERKRRPHRRLGFWRAGATGVVACDDAEGPGEDGDVDGVQQVTASSNMRSA
jgi:hypothetical protein